MRKIPDVRAVGLITNGPSGIQRDKIALLELGPHIDFAIISGDFGAEKPDPAIFDEALLLGGASAAQAIYIGDSPEFDIEGARSANIRAVWYNRAHIRWPLATLEPSLIIHRLADLLPLLYRI